MYQKKSWTFESEEIADKFNDHVREQLPWYDMVSDAVAYIVRNYLTESNTVVDIGASTGNMIDKLMPLLLERKAYAYAIEKSPTMVDVLKRRFENHHNVTIAQADIRHDSAPVAARRARPFRSAVACCRWRASRS